MRWDSNPRYAHTYGGFQDRCLKPLGHPSCVGRNLTNAWTADTIPWRGATGKSTSIRQDAHGLAISTDSDAAVVAFDHMMIGFLKNRADVGQRLAAVLAADPELALAHCCQGYFYLMAYHQPFLPAARAAAGRAAALVGEATAREREHIAALNAWLKGDIDRTLAIWEAILRRHPHDSLALRLAHFANFWLGRAQDMAASIERVLPDWTADLPGYGAVLGCRCFALEEIGQYLAAEPDGRRAIELDAGDLWAAHAVAHVMEMQGRRLEGIDWLQTLSPRWQGGNNIQHHLWWHCALFHLEEGDFGRVLALYDQRFRDLSSPLTAAMPDLYIDVQNAASMLFRLQRQGVAVGARWEELADLAEQRIGDCLSAFTLPHWMMALAATGRSGAADRLLAAIRGASGPDRALLHDIALPVTEAVRAHGEGRFGDAVRLMRPVVGGMWRLGGSHAQQDVLEQLYLDAAVRGGQREDVRLLLQRVSGRRPIPPARAIGWAAAAHHIGV